MTGINALLSGAIGMARLVNTLFFLRFWSSTGDRFFSFFALFFVLQSVGRILVEPAAMQVDDTAVYYIMRLAAYALIVVAVVDKNRRRGRVHRSGEASPGVAKKWLDPFFVPRRGRASPAYCADNLEAVDA